MSFNILVSLLMVCKYSCTINYRMVGMATAFSLLILFTARFKLVMFLAFQIQNTLPLLLSHTTIRLNSSNMHLAFHIAKYI